MQASQVKRQGSIGIKNSIMAFVLYIASLIQRIKG